MKNKLILAFPRSGTKLLANAYQNNGHHRFGEFFNTYSTTVVDKVAKRTTSEEQKAVRVSRSNLEKIEFEFMHSLMTANRYQQYQQLLAQQTNPTIVTAWYATFQLYPASTHILRTHEVLCLKRKNIFDQLLSRIITVKNLNHDGDRDSDKIVVTEINMKKYFSVLLETVLLQISCVNSGNARWIDFDELISGNADLGFTYTVTTKDQHVDLSEHISNFDESLELFQNTYKSYIGYINENPELSSFFQNSVILP